ncbi:metal ABC transporter permease [Salisaeta longa]|uniref:metal ABC transporter permease n=1 Tax=Salisaeta longa TaxID=503170 RepID=UPI0003B4C5E0|nr:metal ABC transporter permease [Salisaeta longa]
MTALQLEIQLVAIVVAVACALPGVFLILRRMAMMSDAISHAILPGIVVGFFITESLGSPLLIVAAGLTGLLTVALVELIERTKLVKEDAAIGIVFPVLFSIGVILIARYAGDVHLDTDAVLLGELAFAPFDRFTAFGLDLGPRALWVMGAALGLNALFLLLFYKELKLATFDAGLAATLGFLPGLLHYALMGLVSLTAVSAFDAVGSILVVALMVGPPATAYLLTDRLNWMIGISAGVGALGAVGGYWLAHALDASIAGAMATATGLIFGAAVLFAPGRGVVARVRLRNRQTWRFAEQMLTIHLLQHENTPQAQRECRVAHLQEHLNWDAPFAEKVVNRGTRRGTVERRGPYLALTDDGRALAQDALERT